MIVGLLGVGHLASSMVEGFLRSGLPASQLLLSPRGKSTNLSQTYGIRVAFDNAALVREADIVILSVRPVDAAGAITSCPWRKGQILLSVCAGIPVSQLSAAPAIVIRAMPLTAAEIGASPTIFFPDNAIAQAVVSRLGPAIPLQSETEFERATVSAAVYGWAQDLIRQTVDWSAGHGNDAETMRQIVSLTFAAAGRMVSEKKDPMDQMLRELVTPGGITELGIEVLKAGGQPEAWTAACEAVHQRLTAG